MQDQEPPRFTLPRLALTIPEAAKSIGVSERHVREMLPELPHLYLGRRVVIPVRELTDWLRDRAKATRDSEYETARAILQSLKESD